MTLSISNLAEKRIWHDLLSLFAAHLHGISNHRVRDRLAASQQPPPFITLMRHLYDLHPLGTGLPVKIRQPRHNIFAPA